MAKAKEEITAELFEKHTGFPPVNDDLERCNCQKVGSPGHNFCGWNYRVNKPIFENNEE